jgi:hypothetical protein
LLLLCSSWFVASASVLLVLQNTCSCQVLVARKVKKKLLLPLLLPLSAYSLTVARCFSFALSPLIVAVWDGVSFRSVIRLTQYPVIFNGTNYRYWVPCLRWHMRDLCLWKFLTGDIPCPPPPVAPKRPTIRDKAADDVKTTLLDEYNTCMESYASQFAAYRIWLDKDAQAGPVLAASMEEHLSADIVNFDHAFSSVVGFFFVSVMSPPASLPVLLLYVKNSYCARVILQLRISMLRCLQCGIRLIPLVLHYHPALVTRVRLSRLLWRLGALMTS